MLSLTHTHTHTHTHTGVLLRKLEAGLVGISHVIVDEIHERDMNVSIWDAPFSDCIDICCHSSGLSQFLEFLEAPVRKGLVEDVVNPFHTEASMVINIAIPSEKEIAVWKGLNN